MFSSGKGAVRVPPLLGRDAMNGAESLVRTLVAGGVEVCFTNPGTSEMHFVAALDRVEGVRCVLALFEGVATGAADAYGRLAGKPAATLLHLGPGLANGLANLHNASRARSPIVNVVGEHATTHRALDAPLTADIAGIARPYSRWIGTPETPDAVGRLTAEAIRAARAPAPGNIATLILPADASWGEGGVVGKIEAPPPPPRIAENVLHGAVALLRGTGGAAALYLGGPALSEAALVIAGRIAAKLGLQLLAPTQIPRIRRGAGLVSVDRVPYPIDMATERLKDIRRLVLVGAPAPVAFFAYPDKPARTTHPDCVMHKLAGAEDDVVDALARLAESLGADKTPPLVQAPERPGLPRGAFTLPDIARVVAALLPDNAIVVDESVTSGRG
ncbi:MAG: acetolactate synthase large subunit, partial [Alphaproteobacteria bacterium]|nr:acetolactate synthase large subunit [Alphaproteobacteria bacterium]